MKSGIEISDFQLSKYTKHLENFENKSRSVSTLANIECLNGVLYKWLES
jgi:hypothetical protein